MILNLNQPKTIALLVFLSCFIYCALASLVLQLYILPVKLPHLHAGDGLLVNTDAVAFHDFAKDYTYELNKHGLGYWKLDPVQSSSLQPATIAALFYYFLKPEPWTLITFNAFIHGLGAVLIYCIAFSFLQRSVQSVMCTFPFIFYPSAISWYGQIHRDGLYILGFLLLTYSLVCFFRYQGLGNRLFGACISILTGWFFLYLSRDYMIYPFLGILVMVFIMGSLISTIINKNVLMAGILSSLIATFCAGILIWGYFDKNKPKPDWVNYHYVTSWEFTGFLPHRIERQFFELTERRTLFYNLHGDARSNLDEDIKLNSIQSIVLYLPRALYHAYFQPTLFYDKGDSFIITIAKAETLISSLFFLGLLGSILLSGKSRLPFFAVLFFAILCIIPFAIAIPNLGTLYRIKYVNWMIVFCLSIVSLCNLLSLKIKSSYPKKIH